jgi:nondiscriminating aspartyl-tRNA synthetase
MERILTNELTRHVGERVLVQGWLQRERRLARVNFTLVRDRMGLAQIVTEQPLSLAPETVIEVEATVVASEQAPAGIELREAAVRVLAEADAPAPVELHRPEPGESLPVRLDHAAVSLRHPGVRERFRVAARSVAAFRSALDLRGFTEIQTPKIVAAATEGGANVFRLDYFGRDAYLAQSPQFYKQTMVGVFERVYETGPVFRAEPHETGRHLAEYVSLDAEIGFVADHREVISLVGDVVRAMLDAVGQPVRREIPIVHFADVRDGDEPDLSPADERRICAEFGELVFVEGFPTEKRPFYTHPDPARPGFSRGFDLLLRGLEVVTGGQRLHRYEDYVAALAARGLDESPFAGYLEAFRYGMPPHGGFALGLERWTAQLVGCGNVREATLFPRDRTRLSP